MTMPQLIYVHGFNSSELSYKSQQVLERLRSLGFAEQFACPRLPWQPSKAIQCLETMIDTHRSNGQDVVLVGSSLGGFYAAYLSAKYDLKAVLVNPAVQAPTLLQNYLGKQVNPYTQEEYVLTTEHINELEVLANPKCQPDNLWLMLQEGDEVLDYRAALQCYPTVARLICEPNGDHSFVGFERYLDELLSFAGFSLNN